MIAKTGNPMHAGRDAESAVVTQKLLKSAAGLAGQLENAMNFEKGLVEGSDLLKGSSNGPTAAK